MLYWPDTVLVRDYQVGIDEINKEGDVLQIFQNYPNPVKDQTTIILYVPEKGKVGVMISDMPGRRVINTFFWSSTESSSFSAWYRRLVYSVVEAFRNYEFKEEGFSVRCVRD